MDRLPTGGSYCPCIVRENRRTAIQPYPTHGHTARPYRHAHFLAGNGARTRPPHSDPRPPSLHSPHGPCTSTTSLHRAPSTSLTLFCLSAHTQHIPHHASPLTMPYLSPRHALVVPSPPAAGSTSLCSSVGLEGERVDPPNTEWTFALAGLTHP